MSTTRAISLGVFRSGHRILVGPLSDDVGGERILRPLGGEVMPGETAAEALRRELRKELGLTLEGLVQLGVLEHRSEIRGPEPVTVFDASFADESLYARATLPLRGSQWNGPAIWLDLDAPSPLRLDPTNLRALLRGEPVSAVRVATEADIPAMHRVRTSVRENQLSSSTVITPQMYRQHLHEAGRGWVYEADGEVVGLSFCNLRKDSIWALFVQPGYEGRGIGRVLHDTMLDWMRSQGIERVTLGTEPGTRAARFYTTAGWASAGLDGRGEEIFQRAL